MKINNKRELQNIAINHSADIDYQDFIKIYRECTKEPYNFLTIDTKLPANHPSRFRKNLFDSYKNDNNKMIIIKVFTTHLHQNLMIKMINIKKTNLQQYKHKTTKCL